MSEPIPHEAFALTLYRILPNGEPRTYTGTTFPANPYAGCEQFVRMCRFVGWIKDSGTADSYGLLEVLDEDGSILCDYDVRDNRAFAAIKKKLDIVVDERVAR